jgi:peptidoglycan hydrolase-like protein with peptidoglycan-binding domain
VVRSALRSLSSVAICVASVTAATAWSDAPHGVVPQSQKSTAQPAGDATLEIQILLDRAGFSPGEIDGRSGANTSRAITAFETARRIQAADQAALHEALGRGTFEVLVPYTITAEDAGGPFTLSIPKDLME